MERATENKSFYPFVLKVLFWSEIVISLRILLFITPYIMISLQNDIYKVTNINNWFIMILSFICLQHFITGIASLGSHIFLLFFHYLGTGMAFFLTISFFWLAHYMKAPINIFYFVPAMFSLMTAVVVFLLKENLNLI